MENIGLPEAESYLATLFLLQLPHVLGLGDFCPGLPSGPNVNTVVYFLEWS